MCQVFDLYRDFAWQAVRHPVVKGQSGGERLQPVYHYAIYLQNKCINDAWVGSVAGLWV